MQGTPLAAGRRLRSWRGGTAGERYLERGVVTPEADAALRRIVISACVRKMEGHQCSHDTAQPAALFAALSAEITGRFTGMLALAGPERAICFSTRSMPIRRPPARKAI